MPFQKKAVKPSEENRVLPTDGQAADWTDADHYAQERPMKSSRSNVNDVALALRSLSLKAAPNTLLGSEEAMVVTLRAARATVRQAARILEREGLLSVKRGLNGGYFATRPDGETIETAVSAYLDTINVDIQDVSIVAAVLWMEAIRKACELRTPEARTLALELQARVTATEPSVDFTKIIELENEINQAIFDLTNARYIELIFQINYVFSSRRFLVGDRISGRDDDEKFVRQWRDAKFLELQGVADGDPDIGILASQYSRKLWRERFTLPEDQ